MDDNRDDEDLRWFFETHRLTRRVEDEIGTEIHQLECAIAALANHAVTHNALLMRDRVRLGTALNRLQIVVSALEAGPMLVAAE